MILEPFVSSQCIFHNMNCKKEPFQPPFPVASSKDIESTHSSHSTNSTLSSRAVIPMFSPCIFSRSSKENLEKMSLEATRSDSQKTPLQNKWLGYPWTIQTCSKSFGPMSQLRQIVGFVLMHDLVLESECFG